MFASYSFFARPGFKVVVALSMLCLLLWGGIHFMVDEEAHAGAFYKKVEEISGYKTSARHVEFSLFPTPTITLERFVVSNDERASTNSFLKVEKLHLYLSLVNLLIGNAKVDEIHLEYPVIELEKFVDGSNNWEKFMYAGEKDIDFITHNDLSVKEGKISYTDQYVRSNHTISHINGSIEISNISNDVNADMSFVVFEKKIVVKGAMNAEAFSSLHQYDFDTDLVISEGENKLNLDGRLGKNNQGLYFNGKLAWDMEDILPWLKIIYGENDEEENKQNNIFASMISPWPLKVEADAQMNPRDVSIKNLMIRSANTNGMGDIEYHHSDDDEQPDMNVQLDFESLDLQGIGGVGSVGNSREQLNDFIGSLLPYNLHANVSLKAKKLHVINLMSTDTIFNATFDQGELIVNQAVTHFPGGTSLLLFGILKQDLDGRIHFDGNAELLGKQFDEFMRGVGIEDKFFVSDHTDKFRAKANLFLSTKNSIISKFKFQAGDLYSTGGATLYADDEKDAEITLRINGLKLDPIALMMTPKLKAQKRSDYDEVIYHVKWLDEFPYRLDFNMILQNYTFQEVEGRQSTFTVKMAPSHFYITDADVLFGDIAVEGDLGYHQRNKLPHISADLKVSHLNIEPFASEHLREKPVPRDNRKNVWSKDKFNFDFLRGYEADIELGFGRLEHPEYTMKNVKMKGSSKGNIWDIEGFSALLWGGAMKGSASIDVTSIPAISVSFSLRGIRAGEMIGALASHPNFKGRLSMNGRFATAGLNTHNWVKNMQGNFNLLGQNVVIRGFDVASLVKAIPSVRTVADVANTMRVTVLKRQTTFSIVEGNFFADGGVFRTNGLKFRSRHAVGEMKGKMDLVSWMMDTGITFDLTTLGRGEYPTLDILFRNSMDDPEINFDTRALEAYIANKKVQ